jgi:geranylgeranyl diphosphate synthase type I
MEVRPVGTAVAVPDHALRVGKLVEQRILDLLDAEFRRWSAVDPELVRPLGALRDLVSAGGKRLRPAFCYWAFVGAGGDPEDPAVVDLGAALELLHAFALVHDDIMDGSEMRRGHASVHRRFTDEHRGSGARGESRRFGEGAAILVGDFAFVYSERMLTSLPARVRPVFDELRVELCVGQFLDLAGSAHDDRDRERAELIERYKSGKYTVERPLHLGAALADRHDELAQGLSAFGVPLGQAFQLRDDLLGVFGDPAITGKPVGDDLREGKLTPLIAAAVAREPSIAGVLDDLVDRPSDRVAIADVQARLTASGAVDDIEQGIDRLLAEALRALDRVPLVTDAHDALADLARFVAWRDR